MQVVQNQIPSVSCRIEYFVRSQWAKTGASLEGCLSCWMKMQRFMAGSVGQKLTNLPQALPVCRCIAGLNKVVQIALVDEGSSGIDEGRDRRVWVRFPVLIERAGRMVMQRVEHHGSDVGHG